MAPLLRLEAGRGCHLAVAQEDGRRLAMGQDDDAASTMAAPSLEPMAASIHLQLMLLASPAAAANYCCK